MSSAGLRVEACLEKDPCCCQTLRRNVGGVVCEVDVLDVACPRSYLGQLGVGEIDVIAAGPPCQAFSQAGKRAGTGEQRGMLLFEPVRYAESLRPRLVIVEQVKGVLSARHDGRLVTDVLAERFGDLGYSMDFRVLNAADYGVPQLRKRVFFVATLPGVSFSWPEPTHGEGRRSRLTVGEAIGDLPPPDVSKGTPNHVDATQPADRRRIAGVPEGGCLAKQLHLPAEQRGRLSTKDTTKFLRVHRERQANTLRCGEIFFHYAEDRYLTPREYMRLHGFPDDYVLLGPVRGRSGSVKSLDQHRQVSNSVPPPLAEALGRSIVEALA